MWLALPPWYVQGAVKRAACTLFHVDAGSISCAF